MPTTEHHARSGHARDASDEADRVAVTAWPTRDLERRAREQAPRETSATASPPKAAAAATPEPEPVAPAGELPAARRASFLADLTRAMRTAAEDERTAVLARCREDAETCVDSMRTQFATAGNEVRERADQDVAALEAWCAGELERIRRETEQNVAERRARLADELAAQEARLEQNITGVAETVTAYERAMAEFFERLLAEEDPSTFAVLARQLPEPPAFTGSTVDAVTSTPAASTAPDVSALDPESLAAAEADAAQALVEAGLETTGPVSTPSDVGPDAVPATRMTVAAIGLVSVASVSNFKRLLSRVDGVRTVHVSSGPNGEFIFSLTVDGGLDLAAAVSALPGFKVELRGVSEGAVDVVAHDLDTE